MTTLKLTPVDTFFFKGQQMTEAGADSTMLGMFPPRPNTIYGALRSAYIHKYISFEDYYAGVDPDVKKWMGTPEQLGDFRIDYCGLFYDGKALLPLPLDYQVLESNGDKKKAYPLSLCLDEAPSSQDSGWRLKSTRNEKSKGAMSHYVPLGLWKKALLSGEPIEAVTHVSEMLIGEPKVGIALDYDRRTTKDKYFYQMMKLRFRKEGGLAVYSTSCPDFSEIHFARVGGENRPWIIRQEQASFSLWTEEELKNIKEQILASKVAKIILLSPAIWEKGSFPAAREGSRLELGEKATVEWLAASIGRPSFFGGWDIVKHRPKRRCFMVPEGTVIYVKVGADQADVLIELANGFSLTDRGAEEGFGFAVIAPGQNMELKEE